MNLAFHGEATADISTVQELVLCDSSGTSQSHHHGPMLELKETDKVVSEDTIDNYDLFSNSELHVAQKIERFRIRYLSQNPDSIN